MFLLRGDERGRVIRLKTICRAQERVWWRTGKVLVVLGEYWLWRKLRPEGEQLNHTWELRLKSRGSVFQAESLNSAAGSDALWVCVNLDGSTPKWLWTPGVPVSSSTLPLLAARDMRSRTFVARQLSSVYTLSCSSFWLLLRTTRWDLDSLKCNYESVGLDSGFYPRIYLYSAESI